MSTRMYTNPLSRLFNYYFNRLFKAIISSMVSSQYYIATNKSKAAFGQQIKAMYAPCAYYLIYTCLKFRALVLINQIFLPCPFQDSNIILLFLVKTHLLNINSIFSINFFFSLVVNLAFVSLSFSRYKNFLFTKIIVLFVCIPTTPNLSFVVIIKKQGSYVKVVIKSLSLQCLLYMAYQQVLALAILYNSLITTIIVPFK